MPRLCETYVARIKNCVNESRRYWMLMDAAVSFLESPPADFAANGRSAADRRASRHGHWSLQAAATNRRRGHGCRLHGRADRANPADRRVKDHQARNGYTASHCPVRGRAAGAGNDGPSQHRASARCRHDRQWPALLRDGVGEGCAHHQIL